MDLVQVLEGMPSPETDEGSGVIVGSTFSDDAAVVRLEGDDSRALVLTTDTIAPLVDDPESFGRIAAANALSDVYAMGGRPLYALNLVFFPDDKLPLETLRRIMAGAASTCAEAGTPIVGGHTVRNHDVKFGLAVAGEVSLGEAGEPILANRAARSGQRLVLSKALGTGVLGTAIKRGSASPDQADAAIASMCRLNRSALEIGRRHGVSACTDVTGFGLLAHLRNMLRASGLHARLSMADLPLLPGALAFARAGMLPGGSRANLEFVAPFLDGRRESDEASELLTALAADAQTSGGLLMAIDAGRAEEARGELVESGHAAAVVGELLSGESLPGEARIALEFSA